MKNIIAICGPTAAGKSRVAIAIAKQFSGEIISADAFQMYRGMNIGTAKISLEEASGIPHHLLDILDPKDSFSVHEFQQLSRVKIAEVLERGKTPIVVGGSGLYLQAVLFDYRFEGTKRQLDEHDLDLTNIELHQKLAQLKPELAKTIHPNNRRRLIRALEITESAERTVLRTNEVPYYDDLILIGLTMPRDVLYQKIESRVDRMIESGLVDEVKRLRESGLGRQASMAIGYKEIIAYLDNLDTLESAIANIKLHTRRYAKRQLTWFKNQMQLSWFETDLDDLDQKVEQVYAHIKEKAKP